jgi:ATP-binding cassette subfamily B protein
VLRHGAVTIGMLALFNMYSQRFWRPIQDLSDKFNILQALRHRAHECVFDELAICYEIPNQRREFIQVLEQQEAP